MRCAVVFPGQGSQRPGVGRPWVGTAGWPLVVEGERRTGQPLAHLLLEADAEELATAPGAQLATFAASSVAWAEVSRALLPHEIVAFAGHSLGEYTAVVAAGALEPAAGLELVSQRAEAMQAAADAQPGGMAAVIGLRACAVQEALVAHPLVWVANLNGHEVVIVAGERGALVAATQSLSEAGARRVLPLAVGGAFHTPLMAPAADRLSRALSRAEWRPHATPVVSGVDGRAHRDGWARRFAEQLLAPVRWTDVVSSLVQRGAEVVVEVGPGSVLTGLTRRLAPSVSVVAVEQPADLARLARVLDPGSPGTPPERGHASSAC